MTRVRDTGDRPVPASAAVEVARLLFRAMESGDPALARQVVSGDHRNHMAADEPPACAEPGVGGFLATSAWLRSAFSELRFEEIDVAVNGDQTFCGMRMHGVHTGPFVVFPPGRPAEVFPATGVRFTAEQVHIFRVRDGLTTEHRAVRDDLGMMAQLGFIPPRPAVALRLLAMHISGRARRAVRAATAIAAEAAQAAHEAAGPDNGRHGPGTRAAGNSVRA
jgi:predicted ester cyclase